jgi:hypothetical protein
MGLAQAGLLFACFLAGRTGIPCRQRPEDSRWRLVPAGRRHGDLHADDDLEARPPTLSERLKGERLELSLFLDSLASSMPTRVAGTAVFLNADPGRAARLLHNLMHNKVLHERVVLSRAVLRRALRAGYRPRRGAPLKENFWSVVIQYGFKDEPDMPAALSHCADAGLAFSPLETSYFIGRETLIPRLGSEMAFWRRRSSSPCSAMPARLPPSSTSPATAWSSSAHRWCCRAKGERPHRKGAKAQRKAKSRACIEISSASLCALAVKGLLQTQAWRSRPDCLAM